jgi:hypothetical protein
MKEPRRSLLFTGTRDRKVRAFDVETGKRLWEMASAPPRRPA